MNHKSVLFLSVFVLLNLPNISIAQEPAANPVIPTMGTVIFEASIPDRTDTYVIGKNEENEKKEKIVSYTRVNVSRVGSFNIKSDNPGINKLLDLKASKLRPLSASEVDQTAIFEPNQDSSGKRFYTVKFEQGSGAVTTPVPYEFNKANKLNKEILINGTAFVSLSKGEKSAYEECLNNALRIVKTQLATLQISGAGAYEFGAVQMYDSRTAADYKARLVFTKSEDGTKANGKLTVTYPSYVIRVIRPVTAGPVARN